MLYAAEASQRLGRQALTLRQECCLADQKQTGKTKWTIETHKTSDVVEMKR